jgi:DNA-binding GntR family transcriptional regulator
MHSSIDRIEKYLVATQTTEKEDRLLREVAYSRLKEAIQSVEVEAGDPLSENRLSNALNISRTPVREALKQLVSEGLLQMIPNRAVVIASRSIQQVSDAIHVRWLLEPEVIRLAAESLDLADCEELESYMQEMERTAEAGDRAAWSRVDRQWHEILCNNCPNKLLGQMVLQALNHMYNEGVSAKVTDQYLIEGTAEHRAVVELILANDGERAAEAMRDHIDRLRKSLFK